MKWGGPAGGLPFVFSERPVLTHPLPRARPPRGWPGPSARAAACRSSSGSSPPAPRAPSPRAAPGRRGARRPERRRRARVPELAGDEHHVEPLGDEERGEGVTQRVEGEPTRAGEPRRLDGRAEALAHVAVVEPAPERVGEHEAAGRAVGRRGPELAQQRHQRGGEDHLALRGGRLQLLRDAAAGERLADVEEPRVEVDVAPAEAERLADAEAAVGQEREEDAVRAGVGDEASETIRRRPRVTAQPGEMHTGLAPAVDQTTVGTYRSAGGSASQLRPRRKPAFVRRSTVRQSARRAVTLISFLSSRSASTS